MKDVVNRARTNPSWPWMPGNGGIQFENGFEAKAFAELTGMELRPGDVVQEV
jgi:hypothetical protein